MEVNDENNDEDSMNDGNGNGNKRRRRRRQRTNKIPLSNNYPTLPSLDRARTLIILGLPFVTGWLFYPASRSLPSLAQSILLVTSLYIVHTPQPRLQSILAQTLLLLTHPHYYYGRPWP